MGTVALNVTGRPRRLSYSKIVEMYSNGQTSPQIARGLKAHHTTVLYALKRSGIDTSAAIRKAKAISRLDEAREARAQAISQRDEQVRRLYLEESLTERQVALRLNISRTAVRTSVIRLQIKPRTMSEAAKVREVSAAHIREMSRARTIQRAEQKRRDDLRVARMMAIVSHQRARFYL